MSDATTLARPRYSFGEEIAHSITHGVGIALSIAGLVILVAFAARYGTAAHVVGCSVFGTSLVLLYTASTLYHSIPHAGAKRVFRILDHSGIYLLIAGTYTPFALVSLHGAVGWSLLVVLWLAAIAGIVFTATLPIAIRRISVLLYLLMGWSALFVAKPLAQALAGGGLRLLVAGGLAYTLGVVFYVLRRVPYHHMIWHLFVLAGSVLHFFAVLLFVVPRPH